jgi:hypothetical protein
MKHAYLNGRRNIVSVANEREFIETCFRNKKEGTILMHKKCRSFSEWQGVTFVLPRRESLLDCRKSFMLKRWEQTVGRSCCSNETVDIFFCDELSSKFSGILGCNTSRHDIANTSIWV